MISSRCFIGFVYLFSLLNLGVTADDVVSAGDLSFIESEFDGVKLDSVNEYIPNVTSDEEDDRPSQTQSADLSEVFGDGNRMEDKDERISVDEVVEEVFVDVSGNVQQDAGRDEESLLDNGEIADSKTSSLLSPQSSLEKAEAYDSLALQYQQIIKENEVVQLDLEDARNRLIVYLESDLVKVTRDTANEKSYQDLLAQHEELRTMNNRMIEEVASLSTQIKDIPVDIAASIEESQRNEAEIKKLRFFKEELSTENNKLKSDIVFLQDTVNDLTNKFVEEAKTIESLNQDLKESIRSNENGSENTKSLEELTECMSTLDSIKESMNTCDTKLVIADNAFNMERLTAANAKLELGLLQRKTDSRMRTLEIETKRCFDNFKKFKKPSNNCNQTSIMTYPSDIYAYLVERCSYDRLVVAQKKVISSLSAGFGGILTYGNTVKESIMQGMGIESSTSTSRDASESNGGMFTTQLKQAAVILTPIAILLSGHVETLGSTIASTSKVALNNAQQFYDETLFPVFHNTVVPHVSQFTTQCTEMFTVGCTKVNDFYVTHLQSHVTTASTQIESLYHQHLEEFVNTYIAPTSSVVWSKISPTVNHIRTFFGNINFLESGTQVLAELMMYRETAISSLKSNDAFEGLFGNYAENVARTIVTLLALYTAYGGIQLIFSALLYVLVPKGRRYGKTHGKERASIRYVRKGSQDLTPAVPADKEIDTEKEALKEKTTSPSIKKPDLKVAAMSPSKRSAPPSPNIFREKIPPYSGTPLKN